MADKANSPEMRQLAAARLDAFRREETRRRRLLAFCSIVALSSFLATLTLLAMGRLDPWLLAVGLPPFTHPKRGAYADCSRPDNKENPFCRAKEDLEVEKEWKGLTSGRKRPFSLYEGGTGGTGR